MACKVKQLDGRSYDFTNRLTEVQDFLKQADVMEDLYTFIGESDKLSQNLRDAKRLLRDCEVHCKSQRGSSFYQSGSRFNKERIVLRLVYPAYAAYEMFAHLVLHEYTHGLVRCTKARMSQEEREYYAKFRTGQSGFHCTAFKKALLRLDRTFGLLTESQFDEILNVLNSRTWKRPYEFERKYKGQLKADSALIQTRGLTAEQLLTAEAKVTQKRKKSAKQALNTCLTKAIMREGSAPRDMGGYDEVCFPVKTTWKDSDVGFCVAVFAKDVALEGWRIVASDTHDADGWSAPFAVHVFEGVTDHLTYNLLRKYPRRAQNPIDLPPEEQRAEVRGVLSTAQAVYDHLGSLGVLGRGSNVALVQHIDTTLESSIKVALVFDPSMMSTIFKSISDGHIDRVAHQTLLYNVLASRDLDYRTLSPSDYITIDSVVGKFVRSFPVPMEFGDWVPERIDDCPPYGVKYAAPGILGEKYKPSKLFWRGYLSDRIIAGNPIHLPGFFTQFNEADQNYMCEAEGYNAPIVYADGGYRIYQRCTGDTHPRYGVLDSGIGAYVESMDISVDSAVSDFISDLAVQLGVADTFDCTAADFHGGLYAEVLCAAKASSLWRRAREEMRRFAEGEIDSVSQNPLGTFDIPYSSPDVFSFAQDVIGAAGHVGLKDIEFSVSSDFLEKLISSRCPTVRLIRTQQPDEICALVSDGRYVGAARIASSDFEAGAILMKLLTGDIDARREMSEYGFLDLGSKPRENFKRSSAALSRSASADLEDLLDLPIMTFTGSGEINLLRIDPDRYADTFEIVQNLKAVPNVSLRNSLSAIEGPALIAVQGGDGDIRYYYRSLGEAFEVTSVVAWWLLYL